MVLASAIDTRRGSTFSILVAGGAEVTDCNALGEVSEKGRNGTLRDSVRELGRNERRVMQTLPGVYLDRGILASLRQR